MHLTIGITDTEARYDNYPIWIKNNDENITIVKLTADHFEDIYQCDGIVLSGGIDSHPRFYNHARTTYPNAPKAFNEARDEFETTVFEYAKSRLPILAICRGMQLINIILGGTLVQDLEENQQLDHRRHQDKDGIHAVNVEQNTLLARITQSQTGLVNSAHHQGVDLLVNDLIINAFSPDGVPEGAEWKDKTNKPFMLCVQWHPERLAQTDTENPFTKNIRTAFLEAIKLAKK